MSKVCIILRGVPGSGKSTLAEYLAQVGEGVICTADDFFTDEYGNYNFDAKRLFVAHRVCMEKFMNAIDKGEPLVIVANTSTRESEFSNYESSSRNKGYLVFSLIVENRHGGVNTHGVPDDKIETMRQRMNIKL